MGISEAPLTAFPVGRGGPQEGQSGPPFNCQTKGFVHGALHFSCERQAINKTSKLRTHYVRRLSVLWSELKLGRRIRRLFLCM